MRHIKASEFKAKCLELLDTVHTTGESVTVTRGGVPIAQLNPVAKQGILKFGIMKGKFEIAGDIVSPEPGLWNFDRLPSSRKTAPKRSSRAKATTAKTTRT